MTRWGIVFSYNSGKKIIYRKGRKYSVDNKDYRRFIASRIVLFVFFAVADFVCIIPESVLTGIILFCAIFGTGLITSIFIIPKKMASRLVELNDSAQTYDGKEA